MPDTQISEEVVDAFIAAFNSGVFDKAPFGMPIDERCRCKQCLQEEAEARKTARAASEATLSGHVVGWRTMDSAPKDGSRFWGKVDDDAIAMLWHPTFDAFVSSWRRMEMAAGYTIDDQPFKDHSPVIHKPEAWQPLPAPPVPEMEE